MKKYLLLLFLYLFAATLFCSDNSFAQSDQSADHAGKIYEQSDQYYDQAMDFSRQGNYQKAAEMFEKSAEAERTCLEPRLQDLAGTLNNAGYQYHLLGSYEQASILYQQALEIDKSLGNEAETAIHLNNIGTVYEARGLYDQAIDNFLEALSIARRFGNEEQIATLLNNIGGVYKSRGKYDQAIDYCRQSLDIIERLGIDDKVVIILNNIGLMYSFWGRYDKALEFFQQALELSEKIGDTTGLATLLNNMGMAYQNFGQYDKAIKLYQQALDKDRKHGKAVAVARNLSNIGLAYCSSGQYDKGGKYYQQALQIFRKTGRAAEEATVLYNIAFVYDYLDQYDKAMEQLQQALAINRRLGREDDVAKNLGFMGALYDFNGNLDTAIKYYHQSITILEKIRKTAPGNIRRDYLASQIYTYQLLASALLKKGDANGLFEAIEQSRARLLAEQIAGVDAKLDMPTLQEVQKNLADDEAVLLFSNIVHDNFILMVITANAIDLREIGKEDFLAESCSQYKKPILLLLEKQRGMKIRRNDNNKFPVKEKKQQAEFEAAIYYYRSLLISPGQKKEAREFGKLLYDLLISPAEKNLVGKAKITIIPDGILGFLPFETLIDRANSYLVQNFTVGYTQSLTIDKLLHQREYSSRKKRKSMLALGGAVYVQSGSDKAELENSLQLSLLQKDAYQAITAKRSVKKIYQQIGMADWVDLPGTLNEVRELSSIISNGDTFTGAMATENLVKDLSRDGRLANYRVLHFATHGLVVPEIPELSALVLSQFSEERDGEDGYLRMGEISQLNLAADFVNLSACETGLGRIYGGEGVVGLTQSFLIAGANGMSVSLWQVGDDSTSRFMIELYKKVNDTGISYNQALTEVKRGFINGDYGTKWQAPLYWSPFVYYGK